MKMSSRRWSVERSPIPPEEPNGSSDSVGNALPAVRHRSLAELGTHLLTSGHARQSDYGYYGDPV
jgi:hypothetical protein